MAARKRNWNEGTPVRYKGKVARVHRGVYIDPEDARRATETQSDSWERGAVIYKKVREVAKKVMESSDFPVAPAMRAPYYAFAQKWYKDVIVLGIDDGVVRAYLEARIPGLDGGVLDEIIARLRREVPAEVPRPAERA